MLNVVMVICQIVGPPQCTAIWAYPTMDACYKDIRTAMIQKPQYVPYMHCQQGT